ncbi:MAG: hypothetical protein L6R28_03865 [Planctomycetes bacterium]|nr:hypothetical protein [Planctomycetota bacterium]
MKSRRIPAFYPGRCRICGKAIAKGTEIYFRKHFGLRCLDCGPHTDADERLPSKRTTARTKLRPKPAPAPEPAKPQWTPFNGDGRFKPVDDAPGFNAKDRAAREGEDGIHRIEYGSVREIVEDALSDYAQTLSNQERLREIQAQAFTGSNKWSNFFTREKLLDQVFSPAPELSLVVERMRERLVGMLDLPTRPRRKVRRGLDCGDELNVDRWLARDPFAWERVEKSPEPRRTLTIGCNVSVHFAITPEQLLYRGAAAVALADYLTQQGCNVGIALFKVSDEPTNLVREGVVRCDLKAPDMPLDLSAVTFSLCEIAFYRCAVVFAGARRWPGNLAKGLGAPITLPPQDRASVDFLIDSDVLGEDAALEWLKRHMEVERSGPRNPHG